MKKIRIVFWSGNKLITVEYRPCGVALSERCLSNVLHTLALKNKVNTIKAKTYDGKTLLSEKDFSFKTPLF